MPDFQTFDLGNVLQQAENIRGSRTVNQLNQQKFDANKLLQDRASMFNTLLQEHFANPDDPNIANRLFQVDPEGAERAVGFSQGQQEQQTAQQQEDAGKVLRGVRVLQNATNAAATLRLNFPEQRQELLDNGFTEEQLNDDAFVKGDLADGLIAHFFPLADPTQFKAEDFFKVPKGDFIQFQNPKTKEIRDVRKDSPEADRLAANPNFQQVSRVERREQGPPGAFTDTQAGKRELDFETQARNTASVVNLIDTISGQIEENGASILSIVGATQRFAGQVGATIDASAEVFGIDLSPSNFDFNDFDKGAVKSAIVRSNVIKLSFLIALARNPSGRITEPDVQAAVREIGQSADPKQFLGVLQSVRNGIVSDFNILARQQRQSANGFEEFVAPLLPGSARRIDGTLTLPTDNSDASLKKRLGLP